MAWVSPITWTAGVLTSTNLNTLRDSLKAIGDPWTTYTPTWTNTTTNPVIGNGTLTGSYIAAGKLIIGRVVITMGSTTTYGTGTGYTISLPTALASGVGRPIFTGSARDTSAPADYPLYGVGAGSLMGLRTLPTTAGNPFTTATQTVPFTWADTDVLTIDFVYEAA